MKRFVAILAAGIALLCVREVVANVGTLSATSCGMVTGTLSPPSPGAYLLSLSTNSSATSAFGPNATHTNSFNLLAATNTTLWTGPIGGIGWLLYGYSNGIPTQNPIYYQPNNGNLGELVSSNLVLVANHVSFPPFIMQFADTNGNIYYDGVSNQINLYGAGSGTLGLVILSNALPASVQIPYVMAPSSLAEWPNGSSNIPLIVATSQPYAPTNVNTNGGSLLFGFTAGISGPGLLNMTAGNGPFAWNIAIVGDSSSPIFTMYRTNLIYIGAQQSFMVMDFLDDTNVWNAWMATGLTNGVKVFSNFYY